MRTLHTESAIDPMPANVELRIASRLLSALMAQSGTRDVADREVDIQHALDVAAALLRRFAASLLGKRSYDLCPAPRTRAIPRAATVNREQVQPTSISLEEWRRCADCLRHLRLERLLPAHQSTERTSAASAGLLSRSPGLELRRSSKLNTASNVDLQPFSNRYQPPR